MPDQVEVNSEEEVDLIRAAAWYSDGSDVSKKVVWDKADIDFTAEGSHMIEGSVVDESFPFPLAVGYGDPVIFPWEGKWYYISTNDNTDDIGLYVREADSVRELFLEGVTGTSDSGKR